MATGNPTPDKPRTNSMDWTLLVPPKPDAADPSIQGTMTQGGESDQDVLMRQLMQAAIESLRPPEPKTMTKGQKALDMTGRILSGIFIARNPQLASTVLGNQTARREQDMQAQQMEQSRKMQGVNAALGIAGLQQRREEALQDFMAKMSGAGRQGLAPADADYVDEMGNVYRIATPRIAGGGLGEPQYVPLSPGAPAQPVGSLKRSSAAAPSLIEDPRYGYLLADRERNRTAPLSPTSPGGPTPRSVPPAGISENIAQKEAGLGALDRLNAAYDRMRSHIESEGISKPGAIARSLFGETRFGGALESTEEFKRFSIERRNSLNAYVKQQTGAQFSVRELQRYESQYPEAWESREIAMAKLAALADLAVRDMQAILRIYPQAGGGSMPHAGDYRFGAAGLGGEEPSGEGPFAGKTLKRSQINSLPQGTRQAEEDRFVAGGGTIIEDE